MVERWLSYNKHVKQLQAIPTEFQVKSFTQMCGEADWACAITEIRDTADGVVTVHV